MFRAKPVKVVSVVFHLGLSIVLLAFATLIIVGEPLWPEKLVSALDSVPSPDAGEADVAEVVVRVLGAAGVFIGALWLAACVLLPDRK